MMMNAEAISHELVAAGLPAKAAEVIAKNLANGAEYHVSAADFADFKTVTRDDFKQINAKLDKIRDEVFAQKEHTTATSTNLEQKVAATKTGLQQEIAEVKANMATKEELAAFKASLEQQIAALAKSVTELAGQVRELSGQVKSLSSWVKSLMGVVGAVAVAVIVAFIKGGGL